MVVTETGCELLTARTATSLPYFWETKEQFEAVVASKGVIKGGGGRMAQLAARSAAQLAIASLHCTGLSFSGHPCLTLSFRCVTSDAPLPPSPDIAVYRSHPWCSANASSRFGA